MAQVVEALVDRNRSRMDVERLKTILGRKTRPHARKKRKSPQLQIVVERLTYGLTILKVYCGKVALKIYTKGERVLRTEAMAPVRSGCTLGVRHGRGHRSGSGRRGKPLTSVSAGRIAECRFDVMGH